MQARGGPASRQLIRRRRSEGSVPDSVLFQVLRLVGSGVCHQLPERSLYVAGIALPLCARCTGTYLGSVLGLALVALRGRARASLLPRWPLLVLFAAFFLVWVIDGLNSFLTLLPGLPHLYEPRNALRLLTGTLEGLALSLTLWPIVAFTLCKEPRAERVVGPVEFALLLAVALGGVAALTRGWPGPLLVAAGLSLAGLVAMFTVLNALLLTVLLHREGTIAGRRQALSLVAVALSLSGLELAALAILRRLVLGI